jgi:hypothetical protein
MPIRIQIRLHIQELAACTVIHKKIKTKALLSQCEDKNKQNSDKIMRVLKF